MYANMPVTLLPRLIHFRRSTIILVMLLQRQADVRRWPVVNLPPALLNLCGFDRKTVSLALRQLETAGLVRVHRRPGRRSTVTLLWYSEIAGKLADMRERGEL